MSSRKVWVSVCVAGVVGVILSFALSALDPPANPSAQSAAFGQIPQRIICLAPNITEAVFALGAGDRVVGVSQYAAYPPEATSKPRVGALYNPALERLVMLRPDLVIIQQKHEKVESLCRQRGIPVLTVSMTSVESIQAGIRTLGERLDRRETARALCSRIERDLADVERRVAGKPPVKVFLCLGRTPGSLKGLFTVGSRSFLSELIEVAGGQNIFADVQKEYPQVSAESLLARAPEVIIETYPSQELSQARRQRLLKDWRVMSALPAVREGRISFVTDDYVLLPGPRIGRIAERLAELLHAEAANGH